MKKFFFEWDILASTVFVFVVMIVMYSITVNMHIFDPFYKSLKDFHYTDLIYSKYHTHDKQDTNIVLVNVGNLDREGIAAQINMIRQYEPKVLALDVIFKERKDHFGDSVLRKALNIDNNIVLAYNLNISDFHHEHPEDIIYTHEYFGNYNSGFYNLVGDSLTTKRYFKPLYKAGEKKYNSFAKEIVKRWDKSKYDKLVKRGKKVETINYIGNFNAFIYYDFDEILNGSANLEKIKGKIVLMGYMGDKISNQLFNLHDAHITPMNSKIAGRTFPDSYGIVVHANIISTIIREDYINEMPSIFIWILAFIICFFHLGVFMYFYVENYKWFHLVSKILQLITSVVLLYIVFLIYDKLNYRINSTIIIVSILLSVDLLYFYDGFLKLPWIRDTFGKHSYITKHHEGH